MASWFTTFDCLRKGMDSWLLSENLILCSTYNAPTLFAKSKKEVFSVQGAWHSPNTLSTMMQGAWHSPNTLSTMVQGAWHSPNTLSTAGSMALSKHVIHYGSQSAVRIITLQPLPPPPKINPMAAPYPPPGTHWATLPFLIGYVVIISTSCSIKKTEFVSLYLHSSCLWTRSCKYFRVHKTKALIF